MKKFPTNLRVYEVGIIQLDGSTGLPFCKVSPDAYATANGTGMALEVKSAAHTQTPDKKLKPKYVVQLHFEMAALLVQLAFLISWGQATSTIFEVKFDEELWKLIQRRLLKWRSAISAEDAIAECEEDAAIRKRCQEIASAASATRSTVVSARAKGTVV
jgi:hypothetical protein